MGSNSAAIENKKRKDELSQKLASEKSAAKIKNDYIKSIKNGVLSGSIRSVIPDSGASSSTGKSASDYKATGQKPSKEFQSAFGEVKRQPILSNIHTNYATRQNEWILLEVSKPPKL